MNEIEVVSKEKRNFATPGLRERREWGRRATREMKMNFDAVEN